MRSDKKPLFMGGSLNFSVLYTRVPHLKGTLVERTTHLVNTTRNLPSSTLAASE